MLIVRTTEMIRRELSKENVSIKDFARYMGLSKSKATEFLNSKEELDEHTTFLLGLVFPTIPSTYWSKYDEAYQRQQKELNGNV